MKSIVVREIVSLVLKAPTTSSTVSSILPTSQNPPPQNSKIRFADAPSTSTPAKKAKPKKDDQKKSGGSGGNPHARYYATITFNQIVLLPSAADKKVAKELIDVYFELFKELLGEGKMEENALEIGDGDLENNSNKKSYGKRKGKGKEVKGEAGFAEVEDSNSKLVSAILTGVNRALPFAKMDVGDVRQVFACHRHLSTEFSYIRFNKHIDTLFLITHKSTFNISLQALLLILDRKSVV